MDSKTVVFEDPKTKGIRELKTGLGKHPDSGGSLPTPLFPDKKDQQYNEINSNKIRGLEKLESPNHILKNSDYPKTGFAE